MEALNVHNEKVSLTWRMMPPGKSVLTQKGNSPGNFHILLEISKRLEELSGKCEITVGQ